MENTTIYVGFIVFIGFLFLYFLNYKKRMKNFAYRIIFLREQNDVWVYYKSIRKQTIENDIVKFQGKTFNLNSTESNYLSKNREFIYFMDYDKGCVKSFHTTSAIMKPEVLEMLVSNNIVGQITKGISKVDFDLKNFLFGLMTGAFIMIVIMMFMMQNGGDTQTFYQQDNILKILGVLL